MGRFSEGNLPSFSLRSEFFLCSVFLFVLKSVHRLTFCIFLFCRGGANRSMPIRCMSEEAMVSSMEPETQTECEDNL